MTFTPNQIINGYRTLERYGLGLSASQAIQEYLDNSIQYGSDELGVFLDDKQDLLYITDNGHGMDKDTFVNKYHTLYAQPNTTTGISSNGIGSKSFVKFSNVRITLTRDKKNKQLYYSIWDVSTSKSFGNPHITPLTANQVPRFLKRWTREVNIFFSDQSIGTMVIIPEIKKWPAVASTSSGVSFGIFRHQLITRLQKRYEYLLTQQNINSISVGYWVNGQRQFSKLTPNDITASVVANTTPTTEWNSTGQFKIVTWETSNNNIQTGVALFRNGVRFDNNEKTYRVSQKKSYAVVGSQNKKIRQAVFWNSAADHLMASINPVKTSGELNDEIRSILAIEYSELDKKLKAAKSSPPTPAAVLVQTPEATIISEINNFVKTNGAVAVEKLLNDIIDSVNKESNTNFLLNTKGVNHEKYNKPAA